MGFSDNFEKTLNDFFFAKHPRQIKKIPEILKEFKGREQEVMLHLCDKYKVNPNTIEGLSNVAAPAPVVEEVVVEATPAAEETVEDTKEEVVTETTEEAPAEEETSEGEEEESKEEK